MKKAILRNLILTFALILTGCAASYRPIDPPSLNYDSHVFQDGIGLSYKYDVLREKGNKKYAKKEDKKGLKLIAVKITNNTDSVINVGTDIAFYIGQNQIFPLEPLAIKETIKQIVPGYLPYLLLSFTNLYVSNGYSTKTFPIGLILGPALTIGNMTLAGSSNKNLLNELYEYDIFNRNIQSGETLYGMIGVRYIGYSPINVTIRK
jgi:hypothetical protein